MIAGRPRVPRGWSPPLIRADRTLARVLQIGCHVDALEELHAGENERALEILKSLGAVSERSESLAFVESGIAATMANLGDLEEARVHLELAELHLLKADSLLVQAQLSGTLSGLYRSMGRGEKALEWEQFLQRLRCPEATRVAMEDRGYLIALRARALGRCVLV